MIIKFIDIFFSLTIVGMKRPNLRMGSKGIGKKNPGNKQQRGGQPTPPVGRRKLHSMLDLLRLWRTSCLMTDGVQPFHATRDNATLPSSLPKVQSQGITLLSLRTIKSAGSARQFPCSGLSYVAWGGTESQTDDHFTSPPGKTAGMPLAWMVLAFTKYLLIQRNVNILHIVGQDADKKKYKGRYFFFSGWVRIWSWDVGDHDKG